MAVPSWHSDHYGCGLFSLFLPNLFNNELPFIMNNCLIPCNHPIIYVSIYACATLSTILVSAPINTITTFGEGVGWRAFLLPKLAPFWKRKDLIFSSIVWGMWQWPIIIIRHKMVWNIPVTPGWDWSLQHSLLHLKVYSWVVIDQMKICLAGHACP